IGNAAVHEEPPSAADVRTLNAAARRADVAPQLGDDWSIRAPRSRAFEGALAALARDAISLFADGDRRLLLRTCEQDDCQGLFLDRSRGERRRWCSMSRCGNRAKAAAFRLRKKEEQS
ncbi:MAG: CGNR zinc finger domain-containing protein, partial [Vulcanimicrobiaceae bacterium]